MSSEAAKKIRSLNDYADLLALLAKQGVRSVVIGGCAVGAYGRLMGERVLSGDLDLFASYKATRAIVGHSIRDGASVFYRPQPRSPQVTMFHWRGLEVNVLSASPGLRDPDIEIETAREFVLEEQPDLPILVADPFQLLANKLRVHRPKDRPHIDVLKRFLEEEVVHSFETERDPRQRIAPAQRFLDVTRARTLDDHLASRILPLLRENADFRFFANHASTAALVNAALANLEDPELREELEGIRKRRRLR